MIGTAPPVFVEVLSSEERDRIRDALRTKRLRAVQWLLQHSNSGSCRTYLSGIHRLMAASSQQAMDLIDRWPVAFLLDRLHDSPALDERVFCRLNTSLMFLGSEAGFPLDNCHLTIPPEERGRLPCLDQNGCLIFKRHMSGEHIHLRFERIHVRMERQDAGGLVLSLPLRPDALSPDVEFHPFVTASGWEKPILPDARMILIESCLELHADRSAQSLEGPATIPLSESLASAHRLFQALWPEIIPWVDLLVPAFVDVGKAPRAGLRLSGSFGPASPIYLSGVNDPMLHAEDILHELQHERFLLYLYEEPCFGMWRDARLYVSPYRDDPRPLRGLHLGLHAFLAVNELRLRSHSMTPLSPVRLADMAIVHRKNLFACKTLLENEAPDADGVRYFAEVTGALQRQHEAIAELAGRRMLDTAAAQMKDHIARVSGRAPGLGNANADWASVRPQDLMAGRERAVGVRQ